MLPHPVNQAAIPALLLHTAHPSTSPAEVPNPANADARIYCPKSTALPQTVGSGFKPVLGPSHKRRKPSEVRPAIQCPKTAHTTEPTAGAHSRPPRPHPARVPNPSECRRENPLPKIARPATNRRGGFQTRPYTTALRPSGAGPHPHSSFPRKRESKPPSHPQERGPVPNSTAPTPTVTPTPNRHSHTPESSFPHPRIVIPAEAGIQTPVTPARAGAGSEIHGSNPLVKAAPKLLTLAPLQAS